MNQKQAKTLHKIAKRIVNAPSTYTQNTITKMIMLDETCTRFHYQQLKRQYKRII